jgi:hypothetical protein
VVVSAGAVTLLGASWKWRTESRGLVAGLFAAERHAAASRYDARDVEQLPAPVLRYFHHVLQDGQPLIVRARLAHEGEFNARDGAEKWAPFRSISTFTVFPPAFVWDARIAMAPGLPVLVRDSYAGGMGQMRGAMFGLIPVAHAEGTPELASGALMRYLAEAAWFPTALLPISGVQWLPIDEHRALATLTDAGVTTRLEFRFDENNEIAEVYSPARYRQVGNTAVATPWSGSSSNVMSWHGMKIPTTNEVRWQLPDRTLPYYRGRVVDVEYEFVAEE